MDAFVAMRKYISSNLIEQKYINNMVIKHDKSIKLLQESFSKLESKEIKNEIYFDGQIFDAYSKIMEIMSKTKNELIIIDNYADRTFSINKLEDIIIKKALLKRVTEII